MRALLQANSCLPFRDRALKGQTSMMEYLLMSFFVLVVIVVLILFLSWWNLSNLEMEQVEAEFERVDTLVERVSDSPLFVKENSVFDDSKLLAIQSLGVDACTDLEEIFGPTWSLEIESLTPRPGCAGPCDVLSYPCCGSWLICPLNNILNKTRVLPVNVYRFAEDRTDLAIMKIGVKSG